MVKKVQLITNVMDRLTQAVVIGVWLLRKVVMSNHPINKGKIELNTRKNQYQSTTHPTSYIKNVGVRRGSRGLDRKLGRCKGHWVNGNESP